MSLDLKQDHDGLRLLMLDYSRLLAMAMADDMPEIARTRIAFSQAFREHMGREDAMVQNVRRRPLTPQAGQVLRDHGRAMVAIFLRYSDHIKYWTPAQIGADWAGYRGAVRLLQDDFRTQMDWEEVHLHPLLDDPLRRAA